MAAAVGDEAGPVEVPPDVRASAETLFGARLSLAQEYAWLLTTDGVLRGLIGPREGQRIWERHLLNCAALSELIPTGASVIDVGSGAGLPGLVLAVARADVSVTLIDSMARRTDFLAEAVAALGLTEQVRVVRARAEESAGRVPAAQVVTARALAPLDQLVRWCLPLAVAGGRVLAIKGGSAADEVAAHRSAVRRLGGGTPTVRECGVGLLTPPTTVVEVVRAESERGRSPGRRPAGRRRS